MADAFLPSEFLNCGPFIIGATGGSGTRVISKIARDAGIFLGEKLNRAGDAIEVGRPCARWINAFMASELNNTPPPNEEMKTGLKSVFENHLAPIGANPRPWGWKSPRSIYLLPFFHEIFPALRFLHVVRDGRDMAFSTNQRQLRNHGAVMLGDLPPETSEPVRAMVLWSRVNLMRAEFAERELRERYFRIRFEDLCANPVPAIERMLKFFGASGDPVAIAKTAVAPPESIGRWRKQDRQVVAELHRVGEKALRKFGYLKTDAAGS